MIKWKKGRHLDPQVILDKIDSAKSISDDGRVSFSAFVYHDAFASLFSMLDFPAKVSDEINIYAIVSKALGAAGRAGKITKDSVVKSISSEVKQEMGTREKKFNLLTSLSMSSDFPFMRLAFDSALIRIIDGDYPHKYHGRDGIIDELRQNLSNAHAGYTKVIVSVNARSVHGASRKALRSLEIIRAVFCLYCNSDMEIFGDKFSPINRVRLGEVHTLHRENGLPVTNMVWFETNFVEAKIHRPKNPKLFKKKFDWFLKQLGQCPYRDTLKDGLLLYVNVLDEKYHKK